MGFNPNWKFAFIQSVVFVGVGFDEGFFNCFFLDLFWLSSNSLSQHILIQLKDNKQKVKCFFMGKYSIVGMVVLLPDLVHNVIKNLFI